MMTHVHATAVTIRPLQATDEALEAEFVRHLSTGAERYRSKVPGDVDHERSMAFVATVEQDGCETAIGVSRYVPGRRDAAHELSLSVADDWRHKGIAELLMRRLVAYARRQGVKQLYCVERLDDHDTRQLAHQLGMRTLRDAATPEHVIYTLTL